MAPSAMSGVIGVGRGGEQFWKHHNPPILKVSLAIQKDKLILYAHS